MMNDYAGIYIHIPFCVKKCGYCDFYSLCDFSLVDDYIDAVIKEIERFYDENRKINADTVFIGGGTPSAVDSRHIERIIEKLRNCFNISENSEITIEMNPKTFNDEKLAIYKDCGINRVSMGLQSAHDDELLMLGRIHNFSDFLSSYDMLIKHGFQNINVDIMYGLPLSSTKRLENTITEILKLKCSHISAYALTLSENVPLYNDVKLLPNEDDIYAQYRLICEYLCNYEHYEISNFGKEKCRHNLKYWTQTPYIGFGAAAHSHYSNTRWSNFSNIKRYIETGKENVEDISKNDEFLEYVMLNLRLNTGIDTALIKQNYKIDLMKNHENFISNMITQGYMLKNNNILSLTESGFFVSNQIISKLI